MIRSVSIRIVESEIVSLIESLSKKLINRLENYKNFMILIAKNQRKNTVGGKMLKPITIGILIGTKAEVRNNRGKGFSVCGCTLLKITINY